jgi:hypothetical protein
MAQGWYEMVLYNALIAVLCPQLAVGLTIAY